MKILRLNIKKQTAQIGISKKPKNISAAEFFDRVLRFNLPDDIDEKEVMDIAAEILKGSVVVYDGSKHIGVVNAEAQKAIHRLNKMVGGEF